MRVSAARSRFIAFEAQRRQAMRAGDPATLPRRDQGQTKKLARDFVDSHRMLSNFLLLLFPILIASSFVPALAAVAPLVLLVIVVEWYFIGRRIRRLAVQRFGTAGGGNLSIGFYAGSRAYLPRRWRLLTEEPNCPALNVFPASSASRFPPPEAGFGLASGRFRFVFDWLRGAPEITKQSRQRRQ